MSKTQMQNTQISAPETLELLNAEDFEDWNLPFSSYLSEKLGSHIGTVFCVQLSVGLSIQLIQGFLSLSHIHTCICHAFVFVCMGVSVWVWVCVSECVSVCVCHPACIWHVHANTPHVGFMHVTTTRTRARAHYRHVQQINMVSKIP